MASVEMLSRVKIKNKHRMMYIITLRSQKRRKMALNMIDRPLMRFPECLLVSNEEVLSSTCFSVV